MGSANSNKYNSFKNNSSISKRNHISPPRLRQTSDVTIFFDKDPLETLSESSTVRDLLSKSVSRTQKNAHICHKYPPKQTGCIFHQQNNTDVPTRMLLRAIESEIDRHTTEIKHQKALDYLSAQEKTGKPENEKLSKSGDNTENILTPNILGTVLTSKVSSLDIEMKQKLVRPSKKLSISKLFYVPTKKKLARRIQRQLKSDETVLRMNPFKVNKDLDLLELREMYHQSHRSKPHELIDITDEKARIQYQVFNDNRLLAPVFNFRNTKYMEEGKHRVRIQEDEDESTGKKSEPLFRFRDAPQLLAVTRKNRRMYRETKCDVVTRIREMNQCNIGLAIKRRMIDHLNTSVAKFDKDIVTVEKEIEVFAKEFDKYLHDNDEKAILSIHRARNAGQHRKTAETALKKIQIHNILLTNHNIRTAEKLSLVDRFINVLYAALPDETREKYLENARQMGEILDEKSLITWNVDEVHMEKISTKLEESLSKYASFSDESDAENNNQKERPAKHQIPPIPVSETLEAMQLLTDYQNRCAETCRGMTGVMKDIELIQEKILQETIVAKRKIHDGHERLKEIEKDVKKLSLEVENLQSMNVLFKSSPQNRDLFRRPICSLHNQIRQLYRTFVDTPDEDPTISTMLGIMRRKIASHNSRLHKYPAKYVKKWFDTVQTNRITEAKIIDSMEKKVRWEGANLEKSIQLPGVMLRRQLHPRSTPADHGKITTVKSREMLDDIVEKLEIKRNTLMQDKEEEEIKQGFQTDLEPTEHVPEMENVPKPVPERKHSGSKNVIAVKSMESISIVGEIAAIVLPPFVSEIQINVVEEQQIVFKEEQIPVDVSVQEEIAEESLLVKEEEKPHLLKVTPDYPFDEEDEDVKHPRLDDLFAALDAEEVSMTGEIKNDQSQSPTLDPSLKMESAIGSRTNFPVVEQTNRPSTELTSEPANILP